MASRQKRTGDDTFTKSTKLSPPLDNGTSIAYLDIGPRFLDRDGKLLADALLDGVHPSTLGYALWAEAMQTEFQALLQSRFNNLTHSMR